MGWFMAPAPARWRPNPWDIITAVTATYLYCIVSAAKKPSTAKAPGGLPGASPADVIPVSPSLWIVATTVPGEVYTGEALERSLGDLEWVGRIALAHEAVVEHFSRQRALTVIPLKLFTMFSSHEKAAEDIGARTGSLQRTVRRLAGAEEWGVRVLRRDGAAALPTIAPVSGAAFLAAKKQARDATRHARLAAAEAAVRAFDSLSEIARDARRRTDAPPGGAAPPLLDAAFLVPLEKRAAFARAARREAGACARAGAEMTLTGPWPAYNFVSAD